MLVGFGMRMKILFLSKSRLSHNLLRAVLPLVPKEIQLECLQSLRDLESFKMRGAFHILLADLNVFEKKDSLHALRHTALKGAKKILIHTHNAEFDRLAYEEEGFKQFHAKPFLTNTLAEVICHAL